MKIGQKGLSTAVIAGIVVAVVVVVVVVAASAVLLLKPGEGGATPTGTPTGTPTTTTAGVGGIEYKQYSSAEYGFSINYPQNWIERTVSGAAVYYNAPPLKLTSTSSWNDPASFNVQIPAPAGGMTLNQLANAGKLSVENMFPGISFTNEKDVQVNGIEGHEWTVVVDNFAGTGINATMRRYSSRSLIF